MSDNNRKIFRLGETHSNACVGKNGFSQNDINYAIGYRDSFKHTYSQLVESNYYYIDAIIFPLVFLARQSIELYLKTLLYSARELWDSDNQGLCTDHSLKVIWDKLRPILDNKPRVFKSAEIQNIENFIQEFDEIDSTGQVFRYPEDNNREKHLSNISLINADIFYKEVLEFLELIEDFYYRIEYFKDFSYKKYTSHLTHDDICDIANMLPQFPWDKDSGLEKVKQTILKQYSISNQELSKAIDIIKDNRKYSGYLGNCRDLEFISLSKVSEFIDLCTEYGKLYDDIDTTKGLFIIKPSDVLPIIEKKKEGYFDYINVRISSFLKSLSDNELADLVTISIIGYDYKHNELYEKTLKVYKQEIESSKSGRVFWEEWLIRKKLALNDWIFRAIDELGLYCLITK